ncbi:MAG: SRPBCC family protein, partial [Verrucomicrobiales bacterium]
RNLDKLTPDSVGFRILHCESETMHPGQIITYQVKILPFLWVDWMTEITHIAEKQHFIDDQRHGPYKVWHHTHRFEENEHGVLMSDEVSYVLPFGPLGKLVHRLFVKKQLDHIFDERQRLCAAHFSSGKPES